MGYYSDRHGNKAEPLSKSGRSYFRERHQKEIPNSESVLSRAAKIGMEPFMPKQVDTKHPFQSGISSTMSGLKKTAGLGSYMQAHDVKSDMAQSMTGDSGIPGMALDLATDPETLMGVGALRNIPGAIKNKFGSKGFGKSMAKLQSKTPNARVNYYDTVMKHSDDPIVSKMLKKSKAIEKFGGQSMDEAGATSEKLSNLTLQESQDFLNSIKDEVTQAVKIGRIKPKELGIAKFLSELTSEQDKVFKGFRGTRKAYGVFKNIGKGINKAKNSAIPGAAFGLAGTAAHYTTKKLLGK